MELVGTAPYHARRYRTSSAAGSAERIGIARALVLEPDLVVCDEPVNALDVQHRGPRSSTCSAASSASSA